MRTARRAARERAVQVLYAAELRGEDPEARLEASDTTDEPVDAYTGVLVRGVAEHVARIDETIEAHAHGWALARMPIVDRTVLRLGVYELLWGEDVPGPVALSEAVALAQELSTDDSPTFVNGVLGAVQRGEQAQSD